MNLSKKDILEFTLHYNRYKKKIYNFTLRMVNDVMVSEDLVQNIFMKFYENYNLIRNKESVQFWLFRTARNEIYMYYRSKKSRVDQFNVADTDELEISSQEDLREKIEISDIKEFVMAELNNMAYDQKEVYLLKEYGELSYKEIASLMEIDENLVKSRLFKTRRRLINSLSRVVGSDNR